MATHKSGMLPGGHLFPMLFVKRLKVQSFSFLGGQRPNLSIDSQVAKATCVCHFSLLWQNAWENYLKEEKLVSAYPYAHVASGPEEVESVVD
jgi:hypothetical protein